jgi:hypothetical protein
MENTKKYNCDWCKDVGLLGNELDSINCPHCSELAELNDKYLEVKAENHLLKHKVLTHIFLGAIWFTIMNLLIGYILMSK